MVEGKRQERVLRYFIHVLRLQRMLRISSDCCPSLHVSALELRPHALHLLTADARDALLPSDTRRGTVSYSTRTGLPAHGDRKSPWQAQGPSFGTELRSIRSAQRHQLCESSVDAAPSCKLPTCMLRASGLTSSAPGRCSGIRPCSQVKNAHL